MKYLTFTLSKWLFFFDLISSKRLWMFKNIRQRYSLLSDCSPCNFFLCNLFNNSTCIKSCGECFICGKSHVNRLWILVSKISLLRRDGRRQVNCPSLHVKVLSSYANILKKSRKFSGKYRKVNSLEWKLHVKSTLVKKRKIMNRIYSTVSAVRL